MPASTSSLEFSHKSDVKAVVHRCLHFCLLCSYDWDLAFMINSALLSVAFLLEQTVWEAQGNEAFGVPSAVKNRSLFILFGQYQTELTNSKLKQEVIRECLISEKWTLQLYFTHLDPPQPKFVGMECYRDGFEFLLSGYQVKRVFHGLELMAWNLW